MGNNGVEDIKMSAKDAAECSETTVEIKIKTLDSQTYTLRVDKRVPVPELKEQIASVTGVLSEQQRLICRGKVLKDDQRLSAYHVEDGHTLHLVVRQPVAPSLDNSSDHAATDPVSSSGFIPGNRVGPGVLLGTFNISEQGDGAFPDISRIVSAVLNSFGIARTGSGEGIDLNQPPSERSSATPGLEGLVNSSRLQSDQATSTTAPLDPLQPPIIPDSLATLSQYLSHLRQEFTSNAEVQNSNPRNAADRGNYRQDASRQPNEHRGLPMPESLAEVMMSTREMLVGQVAECLSQLGRQLEGQTSVSDPLERSLIQTNAVRSGALFQSLGALLLELGRTTMTLRMGQTPAEALVNAGPSVFISSTGPNPIMVQPLPFQPGASSGAIPIGMMQHGSGASVGSIGSGFLPRNIDIRIRTGSLLSRREPTVPQPQGQGNQPSSDSGNANQQDAAVSNTNSSTRESQVRAIPLRTVLAAVPSSAGRISDSSRGSIGILYPVLARVQHVNSGNSSGTRTALSSEQNQGPAVNSESQPVPNFATQQENSTPGGNGGSSGAQTDDQGFASQFRTGLEQMLRTVFPGGHIINDNAGSLSPSSVGAAQGTDSSPETAANASNEGIFLSNILHQIMPMISENSASEPNMSSGEGVHSVETQADENADRATSSGQRCDSQSQPSPKRRRRE